MGSSATYERDIKLLPKLFGMSFDISESCGILIAVEIIVTLTSFANAC